MNRTRRRFLFESLAGATAWSLLPDSLRAEEHSGSSLRLASFRFDVTPPMGHSLCGGWIKPVEAVDDALEAIGVVITGAGAPIVLCAVDWTGLLNDAHIQWRAALAEAAGTTPERVAVQCVHQHNAPFACLESEQVVQAQGDLPHIVDLAFYGECLARGKAAIAEALPKARPLTHIAHGQAKVDRVASNRRVSRDAQGHVLAMRGSSCKDEALISLPEGLIDPWLKTVAFYDGDEKIAACHYYATHPMSYYGDGRVTSDFVGLARKQRQAEEPGCTHIYFTGCAGNISAGKYNDGSPPVRPILAQRIYEGMVKAEAELKPAPIGTIAWRTVDVLPKPHPQYTIADLEAQIANKDNAVANRNRPSYTLTWLRRAEKKTPIVLSALAIDGVSLLHLPAESFIEYQLRAQELAPGRFVATAAYGDGGPWYIPVKEEYSNGGYEVSVAFCDPEVDPVLTEGMRSLLA
ncbi:MAG: hypothetical protein JNK74_15495 [Candidatus Hydrogenedentes bacterium]|nr:hypothetical protein [Candidatus Hydrogenedentota bacterium]